MYVVIWSDIQAVALVDVKKEVAGKPRKLLSLQYNPYDSDDEETREERKARIVCIYLRSVHTLVSRLHSSTNFFL